MAREYGLVSLIVGGVQCEISPDLATIDAPKENLVPASDVDLALQELKDSLS